MFLPIAIAKADAAASVAAHPDEQIREAHTIVPQLEKLITAIVQPRIDERDGGFDNYVAAVRGLDNVWLRQVHAHEALHHSDLGRCDCSAGAVACPEIVQRVEKVPDRAFQSRYFISFHRLAHLVEEGVAEEKDFTNGHHTGKS